MVDGPKIIKALERLMLKGNWHDPDESTDPNQLPATMRDLIEFNFTGMPGYDEDEDEMHQLHWPAAGVPKLSALPISPGDLDRRLPAKICEIDHSVGDCRGMAPLLSAFYKWLKVNEPDNDIDIDHHLEKHDYDGWPLWLYFIELLRKKTNYSYRTIFRQESDEEYSGEPSVWDCAFLPLYDIGCDDDHVPIIEFLIKFIRWRKYDHFTMPDFPEAVFVADSETEVNRLWLIFSRIMIDGRIELLDKKWAAALEALDKYPLEQIAFYECYEDGLLPIASAEDIDLLFKMLADIDKMTDAVDPLVNEYVDDSEEFWKKLLRKINAIAIENPSLAEPIEGPAKRLIEVLG